MRSATVADAASFVLRGLTPGAWASACEGRWLAVENAGIYQVRPGALVVVCEGRQPVAELMVEVVDHVPSGAGP